LPVVRKLARKYGIDLSAFDVASRTFGRIEAGLIRMRGGAT
jgi:pyruvate/2-oxoglutarate dehydrogenase complex dihydrolipoamide acyltransferase (E2) component